MIFFLEFMKYQSGRNKHRLRKKIQSKKRKKNHKLQQQTAKKIFACSNEHLMKKNKQAIANRFVFDRRRRLRQKHTKKIVQSNGILCAV